MHVCFLLWILKGLDTFSFHSCGVILLLTDNIAVLILVVSKFLYVIKLLATDIISVIRRSNRTRTRYRGTWSVLFSIWFQYLQSCLNNFFFSFSSFLGYSSFQLFCIVCWYSCIGIFTGIHNIPLSFIIFVRSIQICV